jgi:hypothetical protein
MKEMLSDLLASAGHAAAPEPVGLGLQSLVRPSAAFSASSVAAASERVSLPRAMQMLERGEIAHPTGGEGDLAGLVAADVELPRRPAPAEHDWSELEKAKAEAAVDAEIDRREMQARVQARRQFASDARVMKRLDEAAQQLETENG